MIGSQYSRYFHWALLLITLSLTACMADNVDEAYEKLNKPPVLTPPTNNEVSVPENTKYVLTVQVTDPNYYREYLRFSLGGVDAGLFSIGEPSGELNFNKAPDFEYPTGSGTDNVYNITIIVTNGYPRSDSYALKVTVTDIANEPPVFNTATTAFSIPENTTVVGRFTAVDPEGGALTYSLTGADASLFSYVSGELKFIRSMDYELPADVGRDNRYAVSLVATDSHSSTILDLTIDVTNITVGDLDSSFFGPDGQGRFKGYVSHNLSYDATTGAGSRDIGNSVAWTPDGKIVVAGSTFNEDANWYDLAVWRLNADGSLDPSFGVNGVFTHHSAAGGSAADIGYSLALLPPDTMGNTKIVVAGSSWGPGANSEDLAVWQLTADGSLDPSFGVDGIFTHHNAAGGDSSDSGSSLALLPDARIVVAGYSWGAGANSTDMAVWRLTADGKLDTDLDKGFGPVAPGGTNRLGYITHHDAAGGYGADGANSLLLLPDARIVVAGYSGGTGANRFDLAVWRLNADGNLDTSFGNYGIFTYHNTAVGNATVGYSSDSGTSLALVPDGRIVVAGSSGTPQSSNLVVWQLTAAGALDTSFGGGDGVFTDLNAISGNSGSSGGDIARLPDGRIVVAGSSYSGNIYSTNMAVWRLTANGNLDSSFGVNGAFIHHNTAGFSAGGNLALLPSDAKGNAKILVPGEIYSSGTNDSDLAVWVLQQ